MKPCSVCRDKRQPAAEALGVCADCLRAGQAGAIELAAAAHQACRREFGLPAYPPRDPRGLACGLCVNQCRIAPGEAGFCGVRRNEAGRLRGGTEAAAVDWYYDPLPTNCVCAPWCEACAEVSRALLFRQLKNLAVFYRACTFDCLFCQNWHFRDKAPPQRRRTPEELAQAVDSGTACICYFGGDPTPHIIHALRASRIALRAAGARPLRICWETNGAMSLALAKRIMRLSLASGGIVKFDLKAWTPALHRALCGVDNAWTLRNFRELARMRDAANGQPPLIASTLLVPGYVEDYEVGQIARFIADCDPAIPYALLAFCPQFLMSDLPTTSREQAQRCLEAAHGAGLQRVRLGNRHLLG